MTGDTLLTPDTASFPLHVLREYALIADGERGALIGPRGDMAWLCAPRWDAEAVFSTLIGGDGIYAVTPTQGPFVWGGSYEEGSLIWGNRWVTTSQVVHCRDALTFRGTRRSPGSCARSTPVTARRGYAWSWTRTPASDASSSATCISSAAGRTQSLGLRNPGLFAEEYDITQRQLRGNLPQAFVHVLLLETAQRLATPWPGH